MLRNFEGQTPDIDYPCEWTYKVVGRSEEVLTEVVTSLIKRDHSLVPSKTSRTGKYVSFELVLTVHDDEDRRGLGQRLHDHVDILFVF